MSIAALSEENRATAPKDDALYEVIRGQYVELPPKSILAVWLASRLCHILGPFAETNRLGSVVTEGLFIIDLDLDLRRRPDVAFVSAERWPLDKPLPPTGDWEVVPSLAIEIISPNDLFEVVMAKVDEYFHHGVEQVWVISPGTRKVLVFDSPTQLRGVFIADDLESALLPGFRLPLAELFKNQAADKNGQPA